MLLETSLAANYGIIAPTSLRKPFSSHFWTPGQGVKVSGENISSQYDLLYHNERSAQIRGVRLATAGLDYVSHMQTFSHFN